MAESIFKYEQYPPRNSHHLVADLDGMVHRPAPASGLADLHCPDEFLRRPSRPTQPIQLDIVFPLVPGAGLYDNFTIAITYVSNEEIAYEATTPHNSTFRKSIELKSSTATPNQTSSTNYASNSTQPPHAPRKPSTWGTRRPRTSRDSSTTSRFLRSSPRRTTSRPYMRLPAN